ncbi:MAG: two-component system sensor histidine kinase NtrB [bacterium]
MQRITFYSIILAVLVVIVFNIHGWLVLSKTRATLEKELDNRLENLSVAIATQLKGRAKNQEVLPIVLEMMGQSELLNIFLVDESLRFIINGREPSARGKTSVLLELDEPEIISAFSGIPTCSRLYAAGPSYLKTAYAPVYNDEAIADAVLGVEVDARFFQTFTNFRRSLFLINLLSLVAIAVIVSTIVSLSRQALRLERMAARTSTFALLGEMAASLAHDLRNPLATILAATERLQIRYDAGDDRTFSYIKEEIERLNLTLTNYLNIKGGKATEMERVDITQLICEVIEALATEISQNGIRIENRLFPNLKGCPASGLPEVNGSRLQLYQAFLNIVLNAIQAQPRGGLIRISGRTEPAGRPRWVVIEIADHGPGISRSNLGRVFEPFFTTKEKGSGLGLFVVKRVVEMHQGKVRIVSDGKNGTTVEVKLPL